MHSAPADAVAALGEGGPQRLYPVVGANGSLEGVVTRFDLHGLTTRAVSDPSARLETILRKTPTVAHPDEPLRVIVHRMAETGGMMRRYSRGDPTSARRISACR
ncbi:MAG TPA: hypothetical protein VH436_10120 [Vicinamibacterales bacterium]